ncbi:MAG TPA: nuclear transport factor 2 family protein [Reyranella sp.]|nr:nuclear transport factor 2 family protein [Reyranella sp.]
MIIEEIRAVVAAKSSALVRRSADDVAALIHPDFLFVTAGGKTLTKADYIDVAIRGKFIYHNQQVSELEVRLFGTTAVASMVVDDQYAIDGREVNATFCALSVFSWTDGRWLWIAGQTMLPRSP